MKMLMRQFWFVSAIVFSLFYIYVFIGTLFGFVAPNGTIQSVGCYFGIVYWLKEAIETWRKGL